MCWLSIPQNTKCTLSISGIAGDGFGLLAEIDNGGCVQPSYVAVDPGIRQIYVPDSRMRFRNKEDQLQKLIHDQFVLDGELPTIIT